MADTPESIEWTKDALAQLTARVSDISHQSNDMARDFFAAQVGTGRGGSEDAQAAIRLSMGLLNVATKLVIELARARSISELDVCEALGKWMAAVDRG